MGRHAADPMDRYLSKINRHGPIPEHVPEIGPCWPWTAACFDKGYGAFRLGEKQVKAHRFGYEHLVGPIPPGEYVLHRCDNPPCQRPDHWFTGTHGDNARDREAKGRSHTARGEDSASSKMTEADVRAIRDRYAAGGIFQRDLAGEYGIDQTAVSHIIRRTAWAHLA